jgi:acetyltransferase
MFSSPVIPRQAGSALLSVPLRWRMPVETGASWRLADGTPVLMRPVSPKDGPSMARFVAGLSPATRHGRFPGSPGSLSALQIAQLTEPDFDDHVGYVITVPDLIGERIIGEARFMVDGSEDSADIALVVADAWQRHGIGTQALLVMSKAAARRRLRWLRADVASSQHAALSMLHHCGFVRTPHPDEADLVQLHLLLLPPFPG